MTSIRKLSERFKWSNTKVEKFIDECVFYSEIKVEKHKRYTIIHILNYEKYQGNAVEIEIKKTTTLTTTKTPTKNDDFYPSITRVSEQLDDDLKRQLERQLERTNKNKDKELKDILSLLSDVIGYLNEVAGTRYRTSVAKTKSLVQARVKEGFTLEDFKTVIDVKCKEWKNDPKMSRYLRPETLFGTKFESYLNQVPKQERNVIPLYQMSKEEKEHYDRLFGNK